MKKVFAALAVIVAFSAAHASEGPMEPAPTVYGVPQWLVELNEQFNGVGSATPAFPCSNSGELMPCEDAAAGQVPQWLKDLNQYFLDHGIQSEEGEDLSYIGG